MIFRVLISLIYDGEFIQTLTVIKLCSLLSILSFLRTRLSFWKKQ